MLLLNRINWGLLFNSDCWFNAYVFATIAIILSLINEKVKRWREWWDETIVYWKSKCLINKYDITSFIRLFMRFASISNQVNRNAIKQKRNTNIKYLEGTFDLNEKAIRSRHTKEYCMHVIRFKPNRINDLNRNLFLSMCIWRMCVCACVL